MDQHEIEALEPYHDLVLAATERSVTVGLLHRPVAAMITIAALRPGGIGSCHSVTRDRVVSLRRATLAEAIRYAMLTLTWNGVPAHLGRDVDPERWRASADDPVLAASVARAVGSRDPGATRI